MELDGTMQAVRRAGRYIDR